MAHAFKRESRDCGGRYVPFSVAICGACSAQRAIQERPGGRNGANDMAPRFRALGWLIGRVRSADRCPQCNADAERPARSASPPKPQQEKPMQAEPPREPSAADRRRIREALDEHYDEPEGRYRGARSDKTLAEQLNVPFKWIADLREAMGLGPDANEQATQLRALFDDAKAEIALAEARVTNALEHLDNAQKRMKRLELDLGYMPKAAG